MKSQYLFVFDFDNTIAQTFEPSPKGIGVKEAYTKTVEDIFGNEGLTVYQRIGGLQNRAPSELVYAILEHDSNGQLIRNASTFFLREHDKLANCVPKNHNGTLEWDILNPNKTLVEILVRQKLIVLTDEIGTAFADGQLWPRPCKGFVDFWKDVLLLKDKNMAGITTAIVSSGHEKPIKRVFEEVFKLTLPDILVTEDDIRWRKYPQELSRRIKPGQLQLAIAHSAWLKKQDLSDNNHLKAAHETKARIVYFGDDPKKDGEMAKGASIIFGLFKDGQRFEVDGLSFTFGNWQDIGNTLKNQEHKLAEGKPINEILLTRPSKVESLTPQFVENGSQSFQSLRLSGRV